ncbi:MAG: PilX N-terminal domain-containing pilus assembly protein [Methylobacter sp.]
MKQLIVPNQRGAVLIFSLIMLLLLTLVSVSMIQQNKQELAMTGNTLEQTKSLARAETDLAQAQWLIDTTRLNPASTPPYSDLKCNSNPANQVDKGEKIADTATGIATVTAVYCLSDKIETECLYNTDGTRKDSQACRCQEGTETYAIKWESKSSSNSYGAQRTVESKYAVNCAGGQF